MDHGAKCSTLLKRVYLSLNVYAYCSSSKKVKKNSELINTAVKVAVKFIKQQLSFTNLLTFISYCFKFSTNTFNKIEQFV